MGPEAGEKTAWEFGGNEAARAASILCISRGRDEVPNVAAVEAASKEAG